MKRAIVSDIHANKEAFVAVLDDIEARGIEDIVCLGDIVGYGPEPAECIALAREKCRLTLMGNHDYALLSQPYRFNPVAAQAIRCHRSPSNSALRRSTWSGLNPAISLQSGGSQCAPPR